MGGLGHLAVKLARAWGCHVTAFTSTEAKLSEARAMGAHEAMLSHVTRNDLLKFDRASTTKLAGNILGAERLGEPVGKKTSGSTLQQYYAWWRRSIAQGVGIYLDPNRAFAEDQKLTIRTRD